MDKILIRGARTHNLKNIDLTLPRDKLIVITGLSGSGKSSLAFDTLYAEGQRRYVESLSAYARQFLSMMEKPDVDTIEGLSPAISIEQSRHRITRAPPSAPSPRSTITCACSTRGSAHHAARTTTRRWKRKPSVRWSTVSSALPEGRKLMLLAPVIRERKGEHPPCSTSCAPGFVRARVNGRLYELDELPKLDKQKKHSIDVVVDRFKVRGDLQQRLAESFETALKLADGIALVAPMDEDEESEEMIFSARFACPICGHSISELEPKLFSFNNPAGACPTCDGLGVKQFFDAKRRSTASSPWPKARSAAGTGATSITSRCSARCPRITGSVWTSPSTRWPPSIRSSSCAEAAGTMSSFVTSMTAGTSSGARIRSKASSPTSSAATARPSPLRCAKSWRSTSAFSPCPECRGTRLRREARHVWVGDKTLPAVTALPIGDATDYFGGLSLSGRRGEIADKILKEIRERLQFPVNVGLDYLTLDRSADTLSGGEAQRIRLASQIGAGLVGVMYILDEPSIGLHQRDNERLLGTLRHLRDIGNTVIVVEHDEDAIRLADYVVDIGPGPGCTVAASSPRAPRRGDGAPDP